MDPPYIHIRDEYHGTTALYAPYIYSFEISPPYNSILLILYVIHHKAHFVITNDTNTSKTTIEPRRLLFIPHARVIKILVKTQRRDYIRRKNKVPSHNRPPFQRHRREITFNSLTPASDNYLALSQTLTRARAYEYIYAEK